MKRNILRKKDGRFCEVEIKIEYGCLTICGTEGRVLTRAKAKKEALAYWVSFFEEQPGEIVEMNRRFGKRFTSASGAAKFVIEQDGELHGLDVHSEQGNDMITESCGQIRDVIAEWFPEVVPLFPWHLNDMHAGCVHQDGWGSEKIGVPCPECDYKYGTAWLKRDLPPEIVKLAKNVAK